MAAPTATTSWIYSPVRLSAEEFLDRLLNFGNAGAAANQNDLVDLWRGNTRVFDRLDTGPPGAFDQVFHELLEFGPRQGQVHMLGTGRIGRDKRQIDIRLQGTGKLAFGFFGCFLQALQRHRVVTQVDAVLPLEFRREPVDDALIEVIAAQVGIPVGGFDFENAVAQFQNGNVERAAAQIVDGDDLICLLVQAVGQ